MGQFGLPYSGTEVWEIEDDSQSNGFQTFLSNFGSKETRATALGQSDYIDGNSDPVDITVFISRESAKQLMGDVEGTTPISGVVGISLHFGYDDAAKNIVLIACSSDGYLARPTGSEFTDINYLSKIPADTDPNLSISDEAADDLMTSFRSNGYSFLTDLEDEATWSVKFDNQILFNLLYSDTHTVSGQMEFHLVIAPSWEGETDMYLSGVAKGKKANNDPVLHKQAPCPKYC